MNNIDFGRHSNDYAEYRPGFPPSFYEKLNSIVNIKGTRSLDLATGPGIIALELAARGSSVTGIDISEGQIAAAQGEAKKRNLPVKTKFIVAKAEDTGQDPNSFDLVTAGQSWHWFKSDQAMKEVKRVLHPGGLLVIANYCYLAEHSSIAHDTEDLILKFNPTWPMAGNKGVFPHLIDEVINGGFELVEQFCYDHKEEFSHIRWRGRMRTCNGVGSGGLSPDEVIQFDKELDELLKRKYSDPLFVEHRLWCVIAKKPE